MRLLPLKLLLRHLLFLSATGYLLKFIQQRLPGISKTDVSKAAWD
jgi:hypothetical protein